MDSKTSLCIAYIFHNCHYMTLCVSVSYLAWKQAHQWDHGTGMRICWLSLLGVSRLIVHKMRQTLGNPPVENKRRNGRKKNDTLTDSFIFTAFLLLMTNTYIHLPYCTYTQYSMYMHMYNSIPFLWGKQEVKNYKNS